MHSEETPITLETITKDLLQNFLNPEYGPDSLVYAISLLTKISMAYSSYSPLYYALGYNKIAAAADVLNQNLQKIKAKNCWDRDIVDNVLRAIGSFVQTKNWAPGEVNADFVSDLVVAAWKYKGFSTRDKDIKVLKELLSKEGIKFSDELAAALIRREKSPSPPPLPPSSLLQSLPPTPVYETKSAGVIGWLFTANFWDYEADTPDSLHRLASVDEETIEDLSDGDEAVDRGPSVSPISRAYALS
jgi:hypothetical protein